jgi:hypothetical protein
MAHTQTPGWRSPGGDAREVWLRRNILLEAAEAFAPPMVRELEALRPLTRRAIVAMRDLAWTLPRITWRHIDDQVGIMRRRRNPSSYSPFLDGITDPARRRDVYRLHRELPAWAKRWFLVKPEGRFIGEWVLETALASMVSSDDQLRLRQPDHGFAGPVFIPVPAFETEPWTGDESATAWRSRMIAEFVAHLDTHLAPGLEQLRNSDDLEPIPRMRSETRRHLALAARWQVGGEEWGDFLIREGLVGQKTSNVRTKILSALDFIGIVPREGMRSI